MIRAGVMLMLMAGPVLADPADLALAESRAFCVEQGGTLEVPEGETTLIDLTGDGIKDAIVSEEGAFCGPEYGYLGGTGGFMIHAVVGDKVQSWLAGAWLVQDIAFFAEDTTQDAVRVLLLAQHGSACNTYGVAPCVLAVTWDGEQFVSAAAR